MQHAILSLSPDIIIIIACCIICILDLGNKVEGDEMDTIARTANHPFFLRSLMHSDAGSNELMTPIASAIQPPTTVVDSRQMYAIPVPGIPLLSHPRGKTAAECYDALDARDQAIRKGTSHATSVFFVVKLAWPHGKTLRC